MNNDVTSFLLITLLVSFVLFLLCRELNCWYWKINLLVKHIGDMSSKLSVIETKLGGAVPATETQASLAADISCPGCQKSLPHDSAFCEYCGYKMS